MAVSLKDCNQRPHSPIPPGLASVIFNPWSGLVASNVTPGRPGLASPALMGGCPGSGLIASSGIWAGLSIPSVISHDAIKQRIQRDMR